MANPVWTSPRNRRRVVRLIESDGQAWSMEPRSLGKRRFSALDDEDSSISNASFSQHRSQQNSTSDTNSLNRQNGHVSDVNDPPPASSTGDERQQKLDMLKLIPLPNNCIGWDRAFEFLIDKFDVKEITKYSVRTFDYIPQDARSDLREVYFAVLTMIDQVPDADGLDQNVSSFDSSECRRDLIYLLHSLRLALPAMLLTYDARLGSFSRLAKIKTNCKLFFDGRLDTLYRNAVKTLGHGAKRQRQITDDERDEKKFRTARSLCVQGNLSKAYKTIVQKGLATEDKIQVLRDKHPSASALQLHDQDLLQAIKTIQSSVDWDELAPPRTIHKVICTKKAGRAADRFGFRIREHLKIVLEKPDNRDLYDKIVLQPIIQGKFYAGPLGLSIGAQLFAAAKGANDVRPVQNPDADRIVAAGVVFNTIFRSDDARQYFETGNNGTYADSRISQRGLSKNGTEWVAREVMRELEQNDALTPLAAPPSLDLKTLLEADVENCFPTVPRQIVLDMVAGKASIDYPNTPYKAGDALPTHPSFRAALPICHLLYGTSSQLTHHFPGREAEFVEFLDGLSQGCPSGSPLTMLSLHLALHITLSKHPQLAVRILAIVDDISLLGTIREIVIIYVDLKIVLRDLFGVTLNLKKSSLLCLQLHTVVDPVASLDTVFQQLPDLRTIPVAAQGTVIVGVPVGTPAFVDAAVSQVLADCEQEFQKLTRFPFANCFLLLLRYCCNQKLMYLMRNVSPQIMLPHAEKFDKMIEHLLEQYFNLDLTSTANLKDIIPGSRLDLQQVRQLANFQIRDSEQRGGLGLSSMASITIPAFLAASFCHVLSTVPILPPGQSFLTDNSSSGLFTNPILYAHKQIVDLGATIRAADPADSNTDLSTQPLFLPELDLFFNANAAAALPNISKMLRKVTRQKLVTQWAQKSNPLLKHVQAVCQADPAFRARMNHLAECEVKGHHPRFDIPSDQSLRFRPTAFLGNILSMINAEFSSHQLGNYLKLVLGLDFPPQTTPDGNCPCGRANDSTGYHRLNCSRWAGRSWAQGHNLVVSALASENRRLGLSVVDIDAAMRRQCTHLSSQARGDILVRTADLEITDRAQGHGSSRKQFVIDVKTVAMVDGTGVWGERWNSAANQHDNPGMLAAEQTKYRKHEAQYAQTGYSFVAFVCSCFGALGPSAIRYLWVLAMLELRQHEALRQRQGMDPLDDRERAQFRATCYRSSSARIAAAMAKATVMRLAGTPSLPTVPPVPRQLLAHNLPGPSDMRNLRQLPPVPPRRSFPPPSPSLSLHAPPVAPPLDLLRSPSAPLSPSARLPSPTPPL